RILRQCEQKNIACQVEFTQRPGHATTLARQAVEFEVQRVIVIGGDGTLNEVAKGLLHTSIPMGIIARGSGNGLARHLGLPLSIPKAIDAIFSNTTLAMDVFTLNGKPSLNVSGIGFDGHIANLFGGATKRGLSGYTKLAIAEFLKFQEFGFEIEMNGQRLKRKAFVLAIANSSQYGNNACIAPGASVTDGLLHLTMLKKIPLYRLDVVYNLFTKNIHKSKFAEMHETTSLTVHCDNPTPYHVDGEPCGVDTTFDIRVLPAALQLIVPSQTKVSQAL